MCIYQYKMHKDKRNNQKEIKINLAFDKIKCCIEVIVFSLPASFMSMCVNLFTNTIYVMVSTIVLVLAVENCHLGLTASSKANTCKCKKQ